MWPHRYQCFNPYQGALLPSFSYIYNFRAPKLSIMIISRVLSKSFILLLLPGLLWLFINATVNKHNHYLSGDYIISHAHPYDKTPSNPTPFGSHHHSGAELFLLSFVSDPLTTTSIVFLLVLLDRLNVFELLCLVLHV